MATIKALARTVDLLGRQQIATVQNAFVELFKNAYDAEASAIRVDYLEHFCADGTGLLSIRDNGVGMSKDDFVNKWFVIGTDNKLQAASVRCQTGEKGIGRLSIALLGNIVLIISYSQHTKKFVASLIHWGLFQLERLELRDLEFPLLEFDGALLPNDRQLEELRLQLKKSLDAIHSKVSKTDISQIESIASDIDRFLISPATVARYISRTVDEKTRNLLNSNDGTWFLVGNPSEMLRMSIEDEKVGGRAKKSTGFSSMLQAFTDKTFSGIDRGFETAFGVWECDAFYPHEYLGEDQFLSHEELRKGLDYFVEGEVSNTGVFKGILFDRSKGERSVEILAPSTVSKVSCGPFRFCLGTLQWQKDLSETAKRSYIDYSDKKAKLDHIGGVYIYRDGIRILPYGSQSSGDWLDIDKQRVHLLGRYFLSKRNIIGAVMLSRDMNAGLQEKAGREGFQKNIAYRMLHDIVVNIITVLSRTYLSIDEESLLVYKRQQDEARAKRIALRELEKENAKELRVFRHKLLRVLDDGNVGQLRQEVQSVVENFATDLKEQSLHNSHSGFVIGTLQDLPSKAYKRIDDIRAHLVVERPLGLPMTLVEQTLWNKYEMLISRLDKELFVSAKVVISELVEKSIARLNYLEKSNVQKDVMLATLKGGETHLERQVKAAQELVAGFSGVCYRIIDNVKNDVLQINKQASVEVTAAIESPRGLNARGMVDWEQRVFNDTRKALVPCYSLERLLKTIMRIVAQSDINSVVDVFGALQQAVSDYEARAEEDFAMIQKGVAVAILEHEFYSTLIDINDAIGELRSLADKAPSIEPLANRVSSGFAHLDSFIRVLDPLQKRIHVDEEDINGSDMVKYLRRAFGYRYDRENITVVLANGIEEFCLRIAPSVLYPVLINLVDNALYWLGTINEARRLVLELRNEHIVVSNNGPEIPEEIKDIIFTRGYSLKPGGRGLGLFIAREVLRSSGYEIATVAPYPGCNVAFSIGRQKNGR